MTDNQLARLRFQINSRQIMIGAILIGAGGVVALAGTVVAGAALAAAYQERVRQMEVPPSELARQHWHRARRAAAVGVGEWRNGRQPAGTSAQ